MTPDAHEPKQVREVDVVKESLVEHGKFPECIDDRGPVDVSGANSDLEDVFVPVAEAVKGPQFLGGSLIAVPIAAELAPEDQALNEDELIGFMFEASERAGFEVSVHMDDHHGEMTPEQIVEAVKAVKGGVEGASIPGCGFAGMIPSADNPLRFRPAVSDFFKKTNLVVNAVRRGAWVTPLANDHASKEKDEAWATRNRAAGKTIDRTKIEEKGVTVPYNHDDEPFEKYMKSLAEVVGEKHPEWGKNISERAVGLNDKWLDIATVALAGKTPVDVK